MNMTGINNTKTGNKTYSINQLYNIAISAIKNKKSPDEIRKTLFKNNQKQFKDWLVIYHDTIDIANTVENIADYVVKNNIDELIKTVDDLNDKLDRIKTVESISDFLFEKSEYYLQHQNERFSVEIPIIRSGDKKEWYMAKFENALGLDIAGALIDSTNEFYNNVEYPSQKENLQLLDVLLQRTKETIKSMDDRKMIILGRMLGIFNIGR